MSFFDLLFPKKCLSCAKVGVYICPECLKKARTLKPICPNCQKPSIDGFTHARCRKPLGLDGLTSVWKYEGVIRKAILALKYKYATEIVKELCGCMVRELQSPEFYQLVSNDYCLIPIPLHWYRGNFRGFNQSEEIGKSISQSLACRQAGLSLRFIPDLLIRKKSTAPQASLEKEARLKNIQGVFVVSSNISISRYPNILLFDDVYTTGSTLKEAAKVLKRAGVKKVWGLTLAR